MTIEQRLNKAIESLMAGPVFEVDLQVILALSTYQMMLAVREIKDHVQKTGLEGHTHSTTTSNSGTANWCGRNSD